MQPITLALALARAERRLLERMEQLEAKLDAGDESVWPAYADAATALAAIAPFVAPGANGTAITTQQLATAFNLTPKTARRKGLKNELPVAPIRLGTGKRAKLRWSAR